MAKSYNPVYVYPTEKTGFFEGQPTGPKLVKELNGLSHEEYGGWWPSFFPSTIGFLVTGDGQKTNVMTISCLAVVNAYPFMIGMPISAGGRSSRVDGPRYSLELLQENGEYTINIGHIDPEITKKAIICGSTSGRDGTDKMAKAGFTPLPSRCVGPPIIQECALNFECRLHSQTLLGTHYWIIGQVEAVYLDKEVAQGRSQFVWRSMPEMIPSGKGSD